MVKLHRGAKHIGPMIRGQKPRPLFPPGELPLFGPPPAYMRRPLMPPPPNRGPPLGFRPPPPLPPPMPPPPMMRHRGPPGPPMPLLMAPVPPPRHPPHFLRGGRGGGKMPMMNPGRKILDKRRMKPNKRGNKKNKMRKQKNVLQASGELTTPNKSVPEKSDDKNLLTGPWVNDAIKVEIEKMNELEKVADEKKEKSDIESYETQKKKVEELANSAKKEFTQIQTDSKMEEHYCETCDRSWETSEELAEHIAQHETCGTEGCMFSAHPKIIAVHIRLQHKTGLYRKISKTNNQDDIDSWIKDRKKNYPTKDRIEEKKATLAEMVKRGEVLEENDSKFRKRKFKGENTKRKGHFKNKRFQRNQNRPRGKEVEQMVIVEGLPPQSEDALKIENLKEDEIIDSKEEVQDFDSFSDEEWTKGDGAQDTQQSPVLCKALMALCSAYDSNDEEESIKDNKTLITKSPTPENSFDLNIKEKLFGEPVEELILPDEDAPLEIKIGKSSDGIPNAYVKEDEDKSMDQTRKYINKKTDFKSYHKRGSNIKRYSGRRKTLLEMLLAKEIKQERNFILQCIRYIINNNYFQAKTQSVPEDVN